MSCMPVALRSNPFWTFTCRAMEKILLKPSPTPNDTLQTFGIRCSLLFLLMFPLLLPTVTL